MRLRLALTAILALGMITSVFAGDCGSKSGGSTIKMASNNKPAAAEKSIVETAVGAGNFTTLVALLKQADLVSTLEGKGPFTVFAPTDEAFNQVPAEMLNALKADKQKLTSVLTYHVVGGSTVMAADVLKMDGKKAKTVNGQELSISVKDGKVMVDNAQVVTTDIKCSNGVIHVIDRVVLPK